MISKTEGQIMKDPTSYTNATGGLQYLAHTSLDITRSINKISQFLQPSIDAHRKVLKRMFKYLKGTLSHGLIIQKTDSLDIATFADSDDRRSNAP